MATYDGTTLEVVNWEKFNPRTDSRKPSWFRLENSLATGPAFHGLDCEQKWLWVFILSLVSQANGSPIVWNAAYCKQLTGIAPKKQDQTIEIFEKFVRLRVSRKVTSEVPASLARYETNERDETRRTNETNREVARSENPIVALPAQVLPEIEDPVSQEILAKVPIELQRAWVQHFEDPEWVKSEVKKAALWMLANPKRKPKSNYRRFMNDWLNRGWESHRKKFPSNAVPTVKPAQSPEMQELEKWHEEIEAKRRELRGESA